MAMRNSLKAMVMMDQKMQQMKWMLRRWTEHVNNDGGTMSKGKDFG